MRIGTVMGILTPDRSAPGFAGRWAQIRVGTEQVVAFDTLGAGAGATVLVAEGDNARRFSQEVLSDAVVAAVIGKEGNNG